MSPRNATTWGPGNPPPRTAHPPETRERYRDLIESGVSHRKACEEIGIGRDTGRRWAREMGLIPTPEKKGPKPTRETEQARADLVVALSTLPPKHPQGSYMEIAERLGIATTTARRWRDDAILAGELPTPDWWGNYRLGHHKGKARERQEFLSLITRPDMSVPRASELVGVTEGTGWRWKKQAGLTGERKIGAPPPQPDPIPYEELGEEARRGADDPGFFAEHYLGLRGVPWAVEMILLLYELYLSPEDEYVVLNAPPGAGKSTWVTFAFTSWVSVRERALGREPRILLGHRAEAKARWYIERIRRRFGSDARLIADFGRFRSDRKEAPWSAEQLLIEPLVWADLREKEPTFAAASYEGSLLSGRWPLIVWDDLLDKSNQSSPEQRDNVDNWLDQEAESRLEPGGLFVISNARYGPDDTSYRVRQFIDEEEVTADGRPRPIYQHIAFKAHYEDRCQGGDHLGPYPEGCLLDPVRLSWRRLRQRQIRRPDLFEIVYQQGDVAPAGSLAEKAHFTGGTDSIGAVAIGCFDRERRFGQLPNREDAQDPLVNAVTVDPGQSSGYWAVQHFLVYEDRQQVLFQGMRRVLQAPDLLYRDDRHGPYTGILEDWWKVSLEAGVPFDVLIVEKNNAQRWIMQYPFFMEWVTQRGVALVPHETGRNKNDPERGVEMVGPVYKHGQLRLPYNGYEEQLFADAFEREATTWPNGRTSDMLVGHWFLTMRLDVLIATAVEARQIRDELEEAPAFAVGRLNRVPAFAQRVLRDRSV